MLVIITPVKNEEKTLLSVYKQLLNQLNRPDYWIIVNDNSTDMTKEIIKKLETSDDSVLSVKLNDSSVYDQVSRYGSVVNVGLTHALNYCGKPDFLGVLDADIILSKNYYMSIINAFNTLPEMGIASGLYTTLEKNNMRIVKSSALCGASMVIRRKCLADINGFPSCPRPDTVTMLKAANRGWKLGIVSSAYAIHLRPNKSLNKFIKLGLSSFRLNYHPINALLSGPLLSLKFLSLSPLGFTVGYLIGTISAYKVDDNEVTQYFNNSFHRSLNNFLNCFLRRKEVHMDPIKKSIIRF